MNRLFSIWLSWLMTVCITVSAVGVPLSKHVCFSSGKVDVRLGQQTHCCEKTTDITTHHQKQLKAKCCELSVSHERVEQPAPGFDKLELQKILAVLPIASPLPFPAAAKANQSPARLLIQSRPAAPPLYGRDLLVRLQTFLI